MRTVSVKLMADAADFGRKMRGAGADVKTLRGELEQADRAGRLDNLTSAATGFGLGLVGAAGMAAKFAMDFEKQMSAVKAATHASAGEMEKLRTAALEAGKDTSFSATEAAKGVEELSKAGISTADILNGGLNGALDLAAAGSMDVAAAAETSASALTQFKLRGQDVPHVADLLAAAAGKAQGSVADMGAALNQAGLVAAGTGLTIEDTTGTLAAFASAGLTGSDAGTSFKTMLQMLQAPSGKTKELMDDLGISAYDTSGQFIGITALAGQLKDKLSVLTPELRANAMAQIFGQDAVRASNILYTEGAEGIQEWINKTNDAGYAAETAATKTDNLAGDLERLKGSLETAAIESGGGLNEGLRVLTQSADALVGSVEKLPTGATAAMTVLAALGGALTLGLVAWVKARTAIAAAVVELNAVGPAGAKAATGLQAATKWAGRAAVAFVGMEVAGAIFDKLGNAAVNVDKLTASLQDYATTGKTTEGLTEEFGKNLDELSLIAQSADAATHGFWGSLNDLTSSIPGVNSAVDSMNEAIHGTSFNDATERMKALDESFTAFIGTQKDAKKAGELWNEILTKSSLDTEQLAALLPNAYKGLQELQKSSMAGAGAQGELATKTEKSKEELDEQKKAAEELKKAFDDLFGRYMSADEAAIKYEETLKSTNKELGEGTKTLKLNSEAGRDNRAAALDLIDAIKDQRDANVENGMSVAEADKKYRDQIGTLGKNMEKLGFNRKEVEALIGKYRDVPDKVSTDVEQPGMKGAKTDTQSLWDKLKGIDGNWTANIKTTGYADAKEKLLTLLAAQRSAKDPNLSLSEARRELGRFMATGGPVIGPGTGTSDSIRAWLSNGEHVWTAAEVTALGGQDAMYQLRAAVRSGKRVEIGDETPGFAGGGAVMPYRFNVSKTKIPEVSYGVPPGGRTSDWIVQVVRAAFPGMAVLSKDRPGARTLSGNVSYHARGRAVDFPPSRPLAEWWNLHYKARTKELITPWNSLNIHNGKRHHYTGAVWRQHNFAGGNAHDHVAMGTGGVINEHIVGVGASGRTYEFGERGRPETVVPGYLPSAPMAGPISNTTVIHLTVPLAAGANPREHGRQIAEALQAHLEVGGSIMVRGQTLVGVS